MEIIAKPVLTSDIEDLIQRAKTSRQYAIESILWTLHATMKNGNNQLLELQALTRKFSLDKVKELRGES